MITKRIISLLLVLGMACPTAGVACGPVFSFLDSLAGVSIKSCAGPSGGSAEGIPLGAMPNYPFEMRRAGIAGEVEIRLIVGGDGRVRDASVLRSTQPEFEAATRRAALKWFVHVFRQEAIPTDSELTIDCRVAYSLDE